MTIDKLNDLYVFFFDFVKKATILKVLLFILILPWTILTVFDGLRYHFDIYSSLNAFIFNYIYVVTPHFLLMLLTIFFDVYRKYIILWLVFVSLILLSIYVCIPMLAVFNVLEPDYLIIYYWPVSFFVIIFLIPPVAVNYDMY